MKLQIDKKSSLPLYSQIKNILVEELNDEATAAELVLTEASLIKRFGVSRAPIRQALKELEDEGYVIRHRAKGTFPVKRVNVSLPPALELGGIGRYLSEKGMRPTSKVLSVGRIGAPEQVSDALKLKHKSDLFHIERVIYVSEVPLAWVSTFLDVATSFSPSAQELEESGSVFYLMEKDLGLHVNKGEQHIWAAGANTEESEALGVPEGAPVLVTETTLYSDLGQAVGWRRAVHKAEDFKYSFGIGN